MSCVTSVAPVCPRAPGASHAALPYLTYAIAPPNQSTPPERREAIAAKQSARIASLPIEALLVYDVQDEAARTVSERPFPFAPKVDPLTYAFEALKLGALPRVVYRAVAEQDGDSLRAWLAALQARGGLAVLVGAPAPQASASLSLPQAFALCQGETPQLPFGGVVIPERHPAGGAEDARVWSKMQLGCRFFVSQTVWCVATTKELLRALHVRSEREQQAAPPILFTFSPCGSAQTLEFLQWLGVAMPDAVKAELLGAKDMLARSVDLASDAFAEIRDFAEDLGLTIGCNVESVTARAAETDASIELLQRIARLDPRSLTKAALPLRTSA
jgi:hypothetical protein